MALVRLIRHGKPAATWGDAADPGLDTTGAEQARAAARALLAMAEPPVRVVSSPLRRCRETAAPFAEALGVALEIDPRVGEVPTPAGIAAAERPAWLLRAFAGRWDEIEGDLDYLAWRDEVAAAVASHAGAAVFSHYVAINAAVSKALGEARVHAFQPDHCSITTFRAEGQRLILVEKGREAATKVL